MLVNGRMIIVLVKLDEIVKQLNVGLGMHLRVATRAIAGSVIKTAPYSRYPRSLALVRPARETPDANPVMYTLRT